MLLVPRWIFNTMIIAALLLTAAGGIGLLLLLARDWLRGKLW